MGRPGTPYLLQYDSTQTMHEKNDGPPATFPPFNLQRIEERFAMSKDTTLVGRAFEELRHGGIVAVRHDTGVRKVPGE